MAKRVKTAAAKPPHRATALATVEPAPLKAAVPKRVAYIRWYRSPLLLIFLLFTAYYRWTVQPHLTLPIEEHGRYNMLADAFLAGKISLLIQPDPRMMALPDPYDPAQNEPYRIHDMSLYKGRYYVYFGPAPVLTLLAPYKLIFRHSLPDRLAAWVFCSGAFIGACLLLRVLLARFFPDTPVPLYYAACIVLGFANTFPFLLRRPDIYEIAIASGQCFLFLGLYFLAKQSFVTPESRLPAWIGGTMLALAVLSRPTLVIGAVAIAWLILRPAWISRLKRFVLPAAIPVCAALAGFALYNYARFDNPFEFGIRYQLAGIYSARSVMFDITRVTGNGYLFLTYAPKLTSTFPFVYLTLPWLGPPGKYLLFEEVGGLLWFSPLLFGILAVPLVVWRASRVERVGLTVVLGSLVFMAGFLFVVDASLVGTMRYEADFAALLFVVAVVAMAGVWQMSSRVWRGIIAGFGSVLALETMLSMFAIGLLSPYGGLDYEAPEQYRQLEKAAAPVADFLRASGVKPGDATH